MRVRVVLAVAVVLSLSYGLILAWSFAKHRARVAFKAAIEDIETAGLPQFEVARETKIIGPAGDRRLGIEIPAGRVEVLPGGPDIVAQAAIYARGKDKDAAARRAEIVQLDMGSDPSAGHSIRARVPEGTRWPSGVSIDLTVKAPPETALHVTVASADARITGISGGVVVESASGDVTVTEGPGPVRASNASGDIRVTGARGRTEANTSSGDLYLSDIVGTVIAHTSSGDISLSEAATQELTASSASGDISLTLIDPFYGAANVQTASGDLSVALPPGSDCRVRATTASGDISTGLNLSEYLHDRRTMTGRLGAGRGSLEMSTASGDIALRVSG